MLPPAQGEIANHPAPAPTVILIDRWNERFTTVASAWVDVGNALQHTESVERGFIYSLTNHGDLFPVQALPSSEARPGHAGPSHAGAIPLNVHLTQDQLSQAQKDGIQVSQDVPVSAGSNEIRAIVLDRKLYALGSVTVRVPR